MRYLLLNNMCHSIIQTISSNTLVTPDFMHHLLHNTCHSGTSRWLPDQNKDLHFEHNVMPDRMQHLLHNTCHVNNFDGLISYSCIARLHTPPTSQHVSFQNFNDLIKCSWHSWLHAPQIDITCHSKLQCTYPLIKAQIHASEATKALETQCTAYFLTLVVTENQWRPLQLLSFKTSCTTCCTKHLSFKNCNAPCLINTKTNKSTQTTTS